MASIFYLHLYKDVSIQHESIGELSCWVYIVFRTFLVNVCRFSNNGFDEYLCRLDFDRMSYL